MTDETVNPFATPGPSSTEAGYEDAQHGDGHHDDSHYAILFLFVSCLVGAVSRHLLAKVPVPYTALLLVRPS